MLIMSLLLVNPSATQAQPLLSSGSPLVSVEVPVEVSVEEPAVMNPNVKLFTDRDYTLNDHWY